MIFKFVQDAGDNSELRRECRKLVNDVVVRLQESLRLLEILDTVSRHEGSVHHSAGVSRHLCGALEALGDGDHLLWLRQDTLRLGRKGRRTSR